MTDETSTTDSPPQQERLVRAQISDLKLGSHAPKNPHIPESLVESIRTYGVLQPLLVRPGAEGYEVLAGFKRLSAAKKAGLTDVPVRVYRVEDEAIKGLWEASNVRDSTRQRMSVPSVNEYRPTGKLGGLLEEELNRSPNDVPYKSIMTVAVIIVVLIWGGIVLKNRWPEKDSSNPAPSATATARPSMGGIDLPLPDTSSSSNRISVARWQLLFSDVGGITVRNESGVPRIVFDDPVFSRLTSVDTAQKERLKEVVGMILQANPSSVLSIIGHTDNDPIRPSSEYRSNEYLSELRANAVVDYLKGTNLISPSQLRVVAMGAIEPPFPNSTAASKVKNRTVTLEIMQPAP